MSASRLDATVPKIPGSAPNCSVTGFQSRDTRKPSPKCVTDGQACWNRMTTITTSRTGAMVATTRTMSRKRSGGRRTSATERSEAFIALAIVEPC